VVGKKTGRVGNCMEQPTQIQNRLRNMLDPYCELILDLMTIRSIFEQNKIRYNDLFKISKTFFDTNHKGLSKPTFNEHIKHLLKKKLICRKHVGKQTVYFYLNLDTPEIINLKAMKDKVNTDLDNLAEILKKTSIEIPVLLSKYFALCELRKTKLIFEYFLEPKSPPNILALAYQAKKQDMMVDTMILRIAQSISRMPNKQDKETAVANLLEGLEKAISQQTENFRVLTKS
jgi:hypothetical protein